MKKVILFCPVRERSEVFLHALEAHRALLGVQALWYVDDNSDSRTAELLADCAAGGELELLRPELEQRPDYSNHQWSPETVSRVARVKDFVIERFLATDADYLFLIDADVVPHPELVAHLVGLGLPVVAEVYWSKWSPAEPWMPNVWDRHTYQFDSVEHVLRLAEPGVYPVGGLGACTLIRRDVLEAGARFAPVPGLDCWGEDRHFCTRAAALGFGLFADTAFPPFHVYRPEQTNEMEVWRAAGSPPEYFREMWLNDLWRAAVELATRPRTRRMVALAAPGETCSAGWWMHFWKLGRDLQDRGFDLVPFNAFSSNPHVTRAALAEDLLECPDPIELVLWLDDDQVISAEQFYCLLSALELLPENSAVAGWAWIDLPRPIVSAGVVRDENFECKAIPAEELFKAEGLIEVGYTGFPAVLMRRSLLERAGKHPFAPYPAPESRWGFTGEDVSFCVNARRRCGARFFVEPRVFLPHMKGKALGLSGAPCSLEQAANEAAGWLVGKVKVTPPKAEELPAEALAGR